VSKKDPNEALVELVKSWHFNPRKFAVDGLGYTLSNQQIEFLDLVGDLFRAKYKKSHGESLSVTDKLLAEKWGVSVASGHGIGKDFSLAIILLWLQVVWSSADHPATSLVTGPNFSTLKSVLWKEFRRHIRQGKLLGGREGWLARIFEIQSDKVLHKELKGEAFIEARTASVTGSAEEQGEALAGRHEQYMILAVDEASGVPDGVFRPIEGAMTGRVNFGILIGNMTRNSGYFYQTQHDRDYKKFWACLRFSTEDSNLDSITGEGGLATLIKKYENKYGRDSNAFRVRIQGLPPSAEQDALIPYEWIERAINRPIHVAMDDPFVYGVDVAWLGKDRSTICKRRGAKVEEIQEFSGVDPMQLVGWVIRNYSEDKEKGEAPQSIFVDTIGMGAGVFTRLREQGYPAVSVVVSETANDKAQFGNKRNELWHTLRKQFQDGTISIPDDKDLIDELSSMKVHPPDSSGVMRVFSKAEWRKAGMGAAENSSPDKADALCLTYAHGARYKAADGGAGWQEDRWLEKNQYRACDPTTGY
jgi:phage terminase large subunit